MYVYSSLVKDSMVGNMFAPIVRVVGIEDKPKNKTVHREFIVSHYLPLRSSSFNKLVLELTDGMGTPMKFNQGNSVAVFQEKLYEIKNIYIAVKVSGNMVFFNGKLKKKDL